MGIIKKVLLGVLTCFVIVVAIGYFNPSPKEVVREAFVNHEVETLSKKYSKADEKVKVEYQQLYRNAMIKGFKECIAHDREHNFNYDGYRLWENLNKMAQFAINTNDKAFDFDKRLAKTIVECAKLRKEYSDGCIDLYKKYKVNENDKITTIRRYIINELSNAKGVFYACGYDEFLGNYFPKYDVDECVLDFTNANFTSLRRGINRLNVVYDGRQKLEMQGGFKDEVDKFKVVPSEAIYIQKDLLLMKNSIEEVYNKGFKSLQTLTAEQNRANAMKK